MGRNAAATVECRREISVSARPWPLPTGEQFITLCVAQIQAEFRVFLPNTGRPGAFCEKDDGSSPRRWLQVTRYDPTKGVATIR